MASHSSLRDNTAYGAALRKFHIFCDIFSIPEVERLPASFALLHSFALWAVADPDPNNPVFSSEEGIPFETISVETARKYLAGVRAWHLAQGFPPPLSDTDLDRINWSLRGMANIQKGKRSRPPRPPITIQMLATLLQHLDLSNSFDACVWAAACCAFFGLMRFGEVSVRTRNTFDASLHPTRADALISEDLDGRPYAKISLPSAKTAKPGERQEIFLVEEGNGLSPLSALTNMADVTPAASSDPLFSWRDRSGTIRPLTKDAAMKRINGILESNGFGNAFGHSFRIGGASFYLAQGVNPEIVRIAGRWKSLAFQVYIRAFEQVASRHLANLA